MNLKGENKEDDPKTCWRCGYKITSGSICAMCGAVNKETSVGKGAEQHEGRGKRLMAEDFGQEQRGCADGTRCNTDWGGACAHAVGGEVCDGHGMRNARGENAIDCDSRNWGSSNPGANVGVAEEKKTVKEGFEPVMDSDMLDGQRNGGRRKVRQEEAADA